MNLPRLPLGVRLIDRDHAILEQMFSALPAAKDACLLPLFEAIAQEICDHFSREEIMMEQAQVPILSCHKAQHAGLLREVETMRAYLATADARVQRHQIGFILTHLVAKHVGGVDQVTSTYLTSLSTASARESDNASLPACMAS